MPRKRLFLSSLSCLGPGRLALLLAPGAFVLAGTVIGLAAFDHVSTGRSDEQPRIFSPRDVSTGAAETAETAKEAKAAKAKGKREELRDDVVWPSYGFDAARTRQAPFAHTPPYRHLYTVRGRSLIEFPPVVAYGKLFFGTNRGLVVAADAASGEVVWTKDLGHCVASSPAVSEGLVYVTAMAEVPCGSYDREGGGGLWVLDQRTGRTVWSVQGGVSESSPVVVDGVLYYTDWSGRVYAVELETRSFKWVYRAERALKSAVAVFEGRLYFGDYGGTLYCLELASGELRWRRTVAGSLYANPAVRDGRVVVGSTAGQVHAFDARSGEELWRRQTDGYVYSSAALSEDTAYVGSYDGHLYALALEDGEPRWRFRADGRISGAPTLMGGHVYFATLDGETTYALRAADGAWVWSFADGKYTPLVADARRVYVVGEGRVYALTPVRREARGAEEAK